jgi:hypothetical protein
VTEAVQNAYNMYHAELETGASDSGIQKPGSAM